MKTTNVFLLPATVAVTIFFLLTLSPGISRAHRIQVVSYPSNNTIVVEATMGSNEPVPPGSEVSVRQGLEGKIILQGQTDTRGRFRFPISKLNTKTNLVINVNAGEGHLGTSYLSAADLGSVRTDNSDKKQSDQDVTNKSRLTPEEQRLQRLVTEAVAREIEPLKHMLARKLDDRPTMRDVIGGIGWLVGIGGLLLALKKKS